MEIRAVLNIAILTTGLCLPFSTLQSAEPEHGKYLYEKHCRGCHESHEHIKEHRQLSVKAEVRDQIVRWQQVLRLNWNDANIDEVLNYLDRRYYHFQERP